MPARGRWVLDKSAGRDGERMSDKGSGADRIFACQAAIATLAAIAVLAAIVLVVGGPLAISAAHTAHAASLPRPMVYLRTVDPTIAQDIRYAGANNFLGRPVKGYNAAQCILTRRTAKALARVQRNLKPRGLALKVYDCYRPRRAVRDFVAWARQRQDTIRQTQFYPGVDKRQLFALHYISKHSTHSYGNTVDLTIIPRGSKTPIFEPAAPQRACTLSASKRMPDNSLDFGTGYDCFNRRSGVGLEAAKHKAHKNRTLLNKLMRAAGFKGYFREWWHFTLRHAGTSRPHDFPIEAFDN